MNTIGLDFIVVKDNRGYQSGFFWSDVQQVIGVYGRAEEVKVKFRNDREGTYTLVFVMSLDEFIKEVEEQLNHPPRASLSNPSYITPNSVAIVPLSNPYKDGPSDGVET